ncbi:MAG TPA: hypothetical protein VLH60_02860, partial [Sedimentisphaerales bacterium]|nr:hypothetical protein [Sedimentisphaerales bacterium]
REGFDKFGIGSDEMIFPVTASCPDCGKNLMEEAFLVDGHPSIRLNIESGSRQGWVRLSCLYGSYSVATEFDVPAGEIVGLLCPHCDSRMKSTLDCSDCEAPMAAMRINGGAVVHICSRRGCRTHMLDLI